MARCLERDLNYRYQTMAEVLTELDGWQGQKAGRSSGKGSKLDLRHWRKRWPEIASIAACVILLLVGFLFRDKLFNRASTQAPAGPTVSLAILPFRNASADSKLDWLGSSLADMLSTDVDSRQACGR